MGVSFCASVRVFSERGGELVTIATGVTLGKTDTVKGQCRGSHPNMGEIRKQRGRGRERETGRQEGDEGGLIKAIEEMKQEVEHVFGD